MCVSIQFVCEEHRCQDTIKREVEAGKHNLRRIRKQYSGNQPFMREVQQRLRGNPSKAERPDVGYGVVRQMLQAFVDENASCGCDYNTS